ncbi:MAG: hydrolase, partial [Chthoniobacterales bacterium]
MHFAFSLRRTFVVVLLCLFAGKALAASFLFDATHAETAGNADWVIDEDSSPQRFPTPDQSTVTASTAETYWKGAISSWGIALVKRGHHVETLPSGVAITYQNASNAQDLSNYKVFVVDEPNKSFTTAEKTAIVKFVQGGGSLFMVADHDGSDRNGDGKDSVAIWNDLFANNSVQAAPFGLTINSNTISPNNESCDTSASDPITHGAAGTITQFVFSDGASITIDPTKNASVKGAVWTSSSHTNSNVMVAYGTFGAGKFVAIGDSSPIDDGTGASGDTLFDGW